MSSKITTAKLLVIAPRVLCALTFLLATQLFDGHVAQAKTTAQSKSTVKSKKIPKSQSRKLPLAVTTPTVSGFFPNTAPWGDPLMITGTNLDKSPTVSVGGGRFVDAMVMSSTQIQIQIPCSSDSGSVVVKTTDGTTTASETFTLIAPSVKITMGNNTDVTNTTQTVSVGQQIGLTGKIKNGCPYGTEYVGNGWIVPGASATPPTAVANWQGQQGTATQKTAGTLTLLDQPKLNNPDLKFYWVAPPNSGTTADVSYTISQGGSSRTFTGQVTFDIKRPTGTVSTAQGVIEVGCVNSIRLGTILAIHYGSAVGTPGITFTPSYSTTVAGSYQWVQLVTNLTRTYTKLKNGITSTAIASGLDGGYPYPSNPNSTADSPAIKLKNSWSQTTTNDNFGMYR